jgi:large subunit ribosomal protein L25
MASRSTDALSVKTRTTAGTTSARALRHQGEIPGTLYGHGAQTMSISLDGRALEDLLHGGRRRSLLTITIDGGTTDTALVRDVQRDPISRAVIHADLQRVGRSEAISSVVPIIAIGTPAGVRDFGGVLDIVAHQIEVTGPADQIPEHLDVDVTNLGIRDHATAGDVKLPPGFTLDTPPETVIVSVEPPRTQVEETPATEAGAVPTVAETETGAGS